MKTLAKTTVRRKVGILLLVASLVLLISVPLVRAQPAASVVVKSSGQVTAEEAPAGRSFVGVGNVGGDLLQEASAAGRVAPAAFQDARADEVAERSTNQLILSSIVGAGVGLAVGGALGALLYSGEGPLLDGLLPGAAAGLALGTPAGVYVGTGGQSRYLWATAATAGVMAAGGVILFRE